MMAVRTLRWVQFLVAALAGFAGAGLLAAKHASYDLAAYVEERGALAARPPGGPFVLTDHFGRTVSDRDFRGQVLLVSFGFTYCPDICPATLQQVALTLDALGRDVAAVQPLFITIDPDRDTVEQLALYVPQFSDRILGLTATPDQIADVARAYKAYYAQARTADGSAPDPAHYMMDHTTLIYLMRQDGKFVRAFRPETDPAVMAEAVRHLLVQPGLRGLLPSRPIP